MKKEKNGIILSDIHFGASDPKRLYEELKEMVITEIYKMDRLDFIIIAGDTFHFKLYLNSGATMYAAKFFKDILTATEDKNTIIEVIEGTDSHDSKQMVSVVSMIDNPRLQIYTTVTSKTICNDINVLYIPEEYVVNQDDYYSEYFEDKFYDLIIGHGMVDKMWYSSKSDNVDKITRAPVFKVSELLSKCHRCYFGHIHTPKTYGDGGRFKYVGSFSVWQFGEEEDKGYIKLTINEETKEIEDEFIVNYMAPSLVTRMIDIRGELNLETVQSLIDIELGYCKDANLVRLIVNISKSMSNFSAVKDFIMVTYGNISGVKLVIGIDIPEDSMIAMKDSMVDKTKKIESKPYRDQSIPIEQKISMFIKERLNKDITPEQVDYYLNEKL